MNPLAIDTLRRSKHSVLTVALVLASVLFAARTGNTQQLRQGISVQLAPTSNAAPMPDADDEGALIVTVTDNGSVYVGIDLTTPTALAEKLQGRL